jgi:hypothetical protein
MGDVLYTATVVNVVRRMGREGKGREERRGEEK